MKKTEWQLPMVVKCWDSGVTLFGSEYWIEHLHLYIVGQVTLSLIESISPSVKWGQ